MSDATPTTEGAEPPEARYEPPVVRTLGDLAELTRNSSLFFGHSQGGANDMSLSGGGSTTGSTPTVTGPGTSTPTQTQISTPTTTTVQSTPTTGTVSATTVAVVPTTTIHTHTTTVHHGGTGTSPGGGGGGHHGGTTTGGTPTGGTTTGSGSGSSPGGGGHSSGPGGGSSPGGASKPVHLTQTGSKGSLPFTGFAAGGIGALGAFASAAGIVLRRRFGGKRS